MKNDNIYGGEIMVLSYRETLEECNKLRILGVQSMDNVPVATRPVLFHNPEMGNEGYCSIQWDIQYGEIVIGSRMYLWGTAHEEQAGVCLSEIYARDLKAWYWAKNPVNAFPGAEGFFMRKNIADLLKTAMPEPFSGLVVCEEMYDRGDENVLVGFGTTELIEQRKLEWRKAYEPFARESVETYLQTSSHSLEPADLQQVVAQERTNALLFLHGTKEQRQEAERLYLLVHSPLIA